MAANWCSGSWRERLSRVGRSRGGAVALSAAIALASARCIADFLVSPHRGGATAGGPNPPGAPSSQARLQFVVQPSDGTAGYAIDSVAVAAVDSTGHPASPTVSLALGGGPSGAALGGSASATASSGVATFAGLVVDSAGNYVLIATAPGFAPDTSNRFAITVPPVASVVVQPGYLSFDALTQTGNLAAEAHDASARRINGVHLDWSTSDSTVAVVDKNGVVTAVGNGTATIRAGSQGVTGAADVTVSQAVASVAVSPTQVSLEDMAAAALVASAADSRGNAIQRSVHFEWRSSKPRTVAVVPDPTNSAHALVRRVSDHGGAVTITVTAEGASATVTVH